MSGQTPTGRQWLGSRLRPLDPNDRSPDDTMVASIVALGGVEEVYVVPVDGGEPVRLEIAPHDRVWYLAWTA